MKKRVLFLCSQTKLRSPTAEAVFAEHSAVEVDSAGLNHDAEVPLPAGNVVSSSQGTTGIQGVLEVGSQTRREFDWDVEAVDA